MAQLHFFNPTQGDLDIDLPKRGNPTFKNKSIYGATKPMRIPIALLEEVKKFITRKESNQTTEIIFKPISDVCCISVTQLNLAPNRFQYKLIHGASGSTGSLRGVEKWDENISGLVLVWLDPENGLTYVINGHNRVTLAVRLGVDELWVKYIKADNPIQARAIGALANIADDKGTAIDAAKFFRDMGYSAENLPKNLDLNKSICCQGLQLSKLHDELFLQIINGDMTIAVGCAIAKNLTDHSLQLDLWELIKTRKNVTADLVSELSLIVCNASKSHDSNSVTLFDMGCFMASNAIYLAELQAYIRQRLSRDRRLFRTVAKSRNASSLERGNNQIDCEKSSQIADESDYVLRLFDELKAYKNSVTLLLNDFADKLMNGENCKDDCYTAICDYLANATLRELAA